MATPVLIPVSEYLHTMYHPDCDYVDGEVQERNLGEMPHSGLQTLLAALFFNNRQQWGLRAVTEQRVQVSDQRFRIPDVSVLRPEDTRNPIVQTAPVCCIEILSPEDTLSRMQARIDDYLQMGVEHIWIIDPAGRKVWTADAQGLHRVEHQLTLPDYAVAIPLQTLWDELDDLAAGR